MKVHTVLFSFQKRKKNVFFASGVEKDTNRNVEGTTAHTVNNVM